MGPALRLPGKAVVDGHRAEAVGVRGRPRIAFRLDRIVIEPAILSSAIPSLESQFGMSGPVLIAVALAWIVSVAGGISARMELMRSPYMMPNCWLGFWSSRTPKRAIQFSPSWVADRSIVSASPVLRKRSIC
jgi:hypothetical protein